MLRQNRSQKNNTPYSDSEAFIDFHARNLDSALSAQM